MSLMRVKGVLAVNSALKDGSLQGGDSSSDKTSDVQQRIREARCVYVGRSVESSNGSCQIGALAEVSSVFWSLVCQTF